jgi:hypothetical protein
MFGSIQFKSMFRSVYLMDSDQRAPKILVEIDGLCG